MMFTLKEIVSVTHGCVVRRGSRVSIKRVSDDSRRIRRHDAFIVLIGQRFNGHDFVRQACQRGASVLIVSKRFSKEYLQNLPASVSVVRVSDTVRSYGDLARYHRMRFNIPFVGITGSTGKTTTKEICASLLSATYNVHRSHRSHNNHIGVPVTLLGLRHAHDVGIVELGTNHIGDIAYLGSIVQPTVAIITNIGDSHLAGLKSRAGVLKEKMHIVQFLKPPKIVLLNADDTALRAVRFDRRVRVFTFGVKHVADFHATDIVHKRDTVSFVLNKKYTFRLRTSGEFNIMNALAAVGCGVLCGVRVSAMQQRLKRFRFPAHRFRKVAGDRCVIFDDTYNSNPVSFQGAVESLVHTKSRGRKIIVMGDMLELGSSAIRLHARMGSFVAKQPIDLFLTLGERSKAAAQSAKRQAHRGLCVHSFDSKKELVSFLRNAIIEGDSILVKGSRGLRKVIHSLQSDVL